MVSDGNELQWKHIVEYSPSSNFYLNNTLGGHVAAVFMHKLYQVCSGLEEKAKQAKGSRAVTCRGELEVPEPSQEEDMRQLACRTMTYSSAWGDTQLHNSRYCTSTLQRTNHT